MPRARQTFAVIETFRKSNETDWSVGPEYIGEAGK